MFSLICAWINCWVNNRESLDLSDMEKNEWYEEKDRDYTDNEMFKK